MEPGAYYEGLVVLAGACLFASILVRSRLLLAGLVVSATLMGHYASSSFIPELSTHKTMKNLCDTWKKEAPGGDPPICLFGSMKHGVFFYTENRIEKLRTRADFQEYMNPERRAYCIVQRETLTALQQSHRIRHPGGELPVVDNSHFKYVLIRNFKPQ